MSTMILHKEELMALLEICDSFQTEQVTVHYEEGGGIGYFLNASVEIDVNGIKGTFTVPITDESMW